MIFQDRHDAGRRLAKALSGYEGEDVLVLGLPRGGVPVAFEVAQALHAPLDVWMVRKIGAPLQSELAIGAVSEDGTVFLDRKAAEVVGATDAEVAGIVKREAKEVEKQVRRFRHGRPAPDAGGRTVIVVDDGVATGGTVRAALLALRRLAPGRLVLAVPVGARQTVESLRSEVDDLVCLHAPADLEAIGAFYVDFRPTPDEEVLDLLARARRQRGPTDRREEEGVVVAAQQWPVEIPLNAHTVPGTLTLPEGARGIVLFAQGNGACRSDPRLEHVAGVLNRSGWGTLLFDLLTPGEEAAEPERERPDIPLLAGRLLRATEWVASQPGTQGLPIGYFGVSTGAAAALVAAADWPDQVAAVVALGGRPDLAEEDLKRVKAPTLLIVGSEEDDVLALNRSARRHLRVESDVAVVPSATRRGDERDALEEVAALASAWLTRHLAAGRLAPALGEAR